MKTMAWTGLALVGLVGALAAAPAAQDAASGASAPASQVEQREVVASELARIDTSFRIDGDGAAAQRDLDALLGTPEVVTLVDDDPALRAARDELLQRLAGAVASGDASIEEAVLDAVRRWDVATLEQLGERGITVLSQKAVAAAAGSSREDPYRMLRLLLQLAPQKGAALALQQLTSDRLEPASVLAALNGSEALRWAWSNVPGGQPELMLPELLELLLLALNKATTTDLVTEWDSLCRLQRELADRDAFGPEFIESFAAHVLQSGRREAGTALDQINEDVQWPSVRPFYERLLKHPDPHVRVDAAERLSHYRDSAALRAAVADPSRDVRRLLATMLRPKELKRPTWPGRNGQYLPVIEAVVPDDDAEMRSILLRLSQDEDPQVREAAVASIGRLSPSIDRAVLERLAQDPDPGVRAVLASILRPQDESDAALLATIISAGDPVILNGLQTMLWELSCDGNHARQAISILRSVPGDPTQLDAVKSLGSNIAKASLEGRNGLTRWALESSDTALLEIVIRPNQPSGDAENYRQHVLASWVDLAPAELARLYPAVASLDPNLFWRLWKTMQNKSPPGLPQAMRPLFEDASQPALVRMAAGVAAARQLDPTLEAELLEFVGGPSLGEIATQSAIDLLQAFGESLPESDRNRVLLALLERAGPPGGLLPFALGNYSPYGPNGEALTEVILRRWGPACTNNEWEPLQKAIEHAGTLRGRLDPQLLIAATRNPEVAVNAVEAMCRQRDPVFLPTLAECIEAPWLPREPRELVSEDAAAAVTAYMSDDAVRILLQAAAETSDAGLRRQCLKGVDTIRQFQEALADWERRDARRATRDDAVGTLAGMLDDPSADVRAEALRALVTLRAVEYLPRIIQGLKDEDAGVREAARAALDRHHALEAEADASAGAGEGDVGPSPDASDDEQPEEDG